MSAVMVFAFLNSKGGDSTLDEALSSGQGAESVVVAARDIQPGETVSADMLTTKAVPAAALIDGRVQKESDIVGKVTTAPIYAGEQVLDAKVTTYEGQSTLAFKVPAGLRALSVMVPHEAWANAGLVQPGDRIDVLAVTILPQLDPLTGQERANVVAGVIVEDVEVLAVSQSVVRVIPNTDARKKDPSATPATGASTGTSGSTAAPISTSPDDDVETYETAISVTIALTPEQASKVLIIDAMKDEVAQFRVVTRQKGDTARISGTSSWTLDEVFQQTTRR
jgi:Flp pilus assembly protein CpaB